MPPVKINGQIVELSSCLLLLSVVGPCALSVPSREAGGRAVPRHREWGNESEREQRRQRDRDKETGREKETWGGGGGGEKEGRQKEIERELRPVEIHHDVRHTDTLQPQIHHRSRVCRRNWTQETSELGRRTGGEGRGDEGGKDKLATTAGQNLPKSSCKGPFSCWSKPRHAGERWYFHRTALLTEVG